MCYMYDKNLVSTLKDVNDKINGDKDISIECCKETLRKLLLKTGFLRKTIDKRQVIMEYSKIKV